MDRCVNQLGWNSYFEENMSDLGLPTPSSIYARAAAAVTTWKTFASFVEHFGTRVTVGEMLKAGLRKDYEMLAAGTIASIYVGGVIGSAAVATGRHLACGTHMIDAISYARRYYPESPWLVGHFQRFPEIYMSGLSGRRSYGQRSAA